MTINHKKFKPDYLLFGLTLLMLISTISIYSLNSEKGINTDFFTIWSVPRTIKYEKIQNIYSAEGQRKIAINVIYHNNAFSFDKNEKIFAKRVISFYNCKIDTIATPFLYTVIGSITVNNYKTSKTLFIVISVTAFFISVLTLFYLVKLSPIVSILLLSIFCAFFTPTLADLNIGGMGQIQLLVLALFIFFHRSDKFLSIFISGLILGLGTMFKPNILLVPILFTILYLFDLRLRRLTSFILGMISGIIPAFIFSILYFQNTKIWLYFTENLLQRLKYYFPIEQGNISMSNLIHQYYNIDISRYLSILLFLVFILIIFVSRTSNKKIKDNPEAAGLYLHKKMLIETFIITFIGCGSALICAQLSWTHYYIFLIIQFIVQIGIYYESKVVSYFLIILAYIALLLLMSLNGTLILFSPIWQSIIINLATIILLISAFFQLCYFRYKFKRKIS